MERAAFRSILFTGIGLGLLALALLLSSGEVRVVFFVLFVLGGITACTVYWPEVLVMAYMFAGRFEFDQRLTLGDLPFSVNQVMLVALVLLLIVYHRRVLAVSRTWTVLGLLFFAGGLIAGMGWTHGPNYGLTKVIKTAGVVVPSVLVLLALVHRRKSLFPALLAVWVVGLGLNSLGLLSMPQSLDHTGRLTSLGSGPNVFSRTVGVSLLLTIMFALYFIQKRSRASLDRGVLFVSVLAFLWLLPGFFLAQSRGPVLALAVAMAVVVLISLIGSWRAMIAGMGLMTMGAMVGDYILANFVSHSRFDFNRSTNFTSIDERQQMLAGTWDLVMANPVLGVGTGGWPVVMFGIDKRAYPHNFFAEIGAELGLLVVFAVAVLFVGVGAYAFFTWATGAGAPSRFALLVTMALFIYFLVNVQISGDIIDNRLIWLFLGLMEMAALQTAKERDAQREAFPAPPPMPPLSEGVPAAP